MVCVFILLRLHTYQMCDSNNMLTNSLVYIISVSAGGLANDSISEERREALARDGEDSQEFQLRALGSKAQLAKWLLYALVLWLLKSSLLHFFAVRLTVCCFLYIFSSGPWKPSQEIYP